MKLSPLYFAYKCLDGIYRKGAYSGIELNKYLDNAPTSDKPLITKLVYGVLDKDIEMAYIIGLFASKVKPSVLPLLKLGVYEIAYMNIPDYAAVNECVKTAEDIGKRELKGFINATLRSISDALQKNSIPLPQDSLERLSVECSYPQWVVEKLVGQKGMAIAEQLMSFNQNTEFVHIRINPKRISANQAEAMFAKKKIEFKRSALDGAYYVKSNMLSMIEKHLYTIMSLGSMLVCEAVGARPDDKVLDVCAAPGGKSIYISQQKGAHVLACELHPHRAQLIAAYAERMGAEIEIKVRDATVKSEDFIDRFDKVLCDVPCSGYGVVYSKPDIKLNRKEEDLTALAELQLSILDNCADYVKKGGTLVYSTCTIFKEENEAVIERFLNLNSDFVLQRVCLPAPFDKSINNLGQAILLPSEHLNEAFFIAVMQRK